MATKQNTKAPVVVFLAANPNFCKEGATYKKAFDKFTKEGGKCREQGFKYYFEQYMAGAVSVEDVTPSRTERVKVDYKTIVLKPFITGKAKLPKQLFEPLKSGMGIDRLISTEGGMMRGTTIIVPGEAGIGKSTVCYGMAACIKKKDPKLKVCVVNSEMKRTDLEFEFHKNNKKWMATIDFILLHDYGYDKADATLEKVFHSGYDFVVVDSVEDIVEKLRDYCDYTSSKAENFMLGLFSNANDAIENEGAHTAIMAVQQFTKGGVFVGSNKLSHNTTGMLFLRKDAHGNRYGMFTKNRRNGKFVHSKMFYSLNAEGEIVWDETAFDDHIKQEEMMKTAQEQLKASPERFREVFGKVNIGEITNSNGNLSDEFEGEGFDEEEFDEED
jgi:predicted ATP-dependent serine protease